MDVSMLERMHLRFFRQHATFKGEAAVSAMESHGLTGDANVEQQHKRHCRLAWYQWRLGLLEEELAKTHGNHETFQYRDGLSCLCSQ